MPLEPKLLKAALARLGTGEGLGKVTETPLTVKSFGQKSLHKIQVELPQAPVNLVTKQYLTQDMPMFLSGNTGNREIQFFTSPLFAQIQSFFTIPYLSCSDDILVMRDVTDEMAAFGPPRLPSEDQMRAIIEAVARKDAATGHSQEEWLTSCSSILANTRHLFAALAEDEENTLAHKCREEWPWLAEGFSAFASQYPLLADKLLESLADEAIGASLEQHPHSVQHGDFYFGNIGLTTDNRAVVVDWENLSWAPIGLDLAFLVAGMPPLPFTDKYLSWYVEAFNSTSPTPISLEQVQKIQDDLHHWHFLTSDVLDMLHFGFWPKSPLPREHRDQIQADLVEQLSAL